MSSLDSLFAEPAPAVAIERPPPRPREGATVTTPCGWTIDFLTKPYRHYKIDGKKVDASASQVTDALDKPVLKWWGQGIGVEGVLELIRRGIVDPDQLAGADPKSLVALLTEQKLTVNHVRQAAADRGSRVHDAMEDWANGAPLDRDGLPDDERGYVDGLAAFIADVQPEPNGVEVIVGSKQHSWAGRCDLQRLVIPKPVIACVAIDYKTGKETRTIVPAGSYLTDLKTSSGVWLEQHLQVAGYEGGSIECGYPPTDHRAILRVTVDGRYEFVETVADYEDFLAVKYARDAVKRVEKRAA